MPHFKILPSSRLAAAAAECLFADLDEAIARQGSASWVLTGGSTPLAAYHEVARIAAQRQESAAPLPWERVHMLMGDERLVAHEHPDSNWGQAMGALMVDSPLRAARLLPPPEDPQQPMQAAQAYASALCASLPPSRVPLAGGAPGLVLDVVWLGVGEDGHCLSLFPGHPELDVHDQVVVAVGNAPKPPPERISLTLAALTEVRCALILAAGSGKAEAIGRLARKDDQPITRAVETIEAGGGIVTVLVDEAAARNLPPPI